jgi:hypothetical protein
MATNIQSKEIILTNAVAFVKPNLRDRVKAAILKGDQELHQLLTHLPGNPVSV